MMAPHSPRADGAELSDLLADPDILRLTALGMKTMEVAHDLGNLLQVVGSAVRLIDRNVAPTASAELRFFIAGALASVERAATLSRRILARSRPKGVVNEVTYLDEVLADIQQMIALAGGPDVALEIVSSDAVPAVACDKRDLENVILNLVINARDAMDGKGHLRLSLDREDHGRVGGFGQRRPEVVLRVEDTGCGMRPEVAAQVFRPFFTTKANGAGTGLGLAMVSDFAKRLDGSVSLESEVGRGTTVTLRMPSCGG
jgi:signal transduction histidine kinase